MHRVSISLPQTEPSLYTVFFSYVVYVHNTSCIHTHIQLLLRARSSSAFFFFFILHLVIYSTMYEEEEGDMFTTYTPRAKRVCVLCSAMCILPYSFNELAFLSVVQTSLAFCACYAYNLHYSICNTVL